MQPPGVPQPAPHKASGTRPVGLVVLIALLVGGVVGSTCATCANLIGSGAAGREDLFASGKKVGVVELVGPITDASEFIRELREQALRDDLVGIVVRIDSPGGAVAPSQEIYSAMRWAAKKKPIVASMGNVAASGGFWASLGADWVFASPGSVTGSIGVITQTPDLRGIASLLRFQMRTYKSGPLKDAGNPFREATAADEALFMGLINDIYDQFVQAVASRRGLSVERVRELADGRVLTGRGALEADLVDELGGLYDAARKAVSLAEAKKNKAEGITTSTSSTAEVEDPVLVYPKKAKPSVFDLIGNAAGSGVREGVKAALDEQTDERPLVELR